MEVGAVLERVSGRLKQARADQRLTLEALSQMSGVSRSMLSQIESGKSSPTVATLWNLTKALGIDLAELLDERRDALSISVVRQDQTPVIKGLGRGCTLRILSDATSARSLEVYDLAFEDGGELRSEPHWPGCREHLTVLEGAVSLTSGQDEVRLERGDAATYAADVPHSISALSTPVRLQLVVYSS